MGHQFDFKTCQQKIRNLKKSYKLVIDNNRKTGRGRKTCKYFDKLDSIFGKRPSFRPSVTEEIGTGECSSPKCSKKDDKPGENPGSSTTTIPKKRKSKEDLITVLKNKWEEQQEIQQKQHEERMTLFREYIEILKKSRKNEI